jgi:hypothetical protein
LGVAKRKVDGDIVRAQGLPVDEQGFALFRSSENLVYALGQPRTVETLV